MFAKELKKQYAYFNYDANVLVYFINIEEKMFSLICKRDVISINKNENYPRTLTINLHAFLNYKEIGHFSDIYEFRIFANKFKENYIFT